MDERRTTTKQRILDAAIDRFGRQGYKKTTLEEVASDVGLVKSAVYKHFPSKEALFNAVVDYFTAEYFEIAQNAAKTHRTLKTQLYRLIDDIFDHQQVLFDRRKLSMEQWLEFIPYVFGRLSQHRSRYVDVYTNLIQRAVERGEVACNAPCDYARILNATMDQLYHEHFLGLLSAFEARRMQKLAVDIFLAGITKQGTEE